jgi:adenine-specific DNA-methyltransferase
VVKSGIVLLIMAIKLKQTLEKALKSESAFFDSESGELNYTKVKDSADKIDKKLISLLADNKDLKDKFFTKIKDVYVFNIQDFKFFLDESKVDNSYTQYANKIGLADNGGLIENRSEVVLDFPFKDCVLEGGQSTEEGTDIYFEYSDKAGKYEEKTAKRNEVFFNQVLAHDEIDRLYDRKALVNWKRFTKDSKKDGEAVKEIKRDKTGLIQENLIIKGNNLLALHSLKSEFTGKIKLIYIDPPYNPESVANTFTYNNNFNHSSWLTFIKNRADISMNLLKDEGFFCIAIDHYELFYLGVLLDEIFSRENRVGIIAVETNPGGRTDSKFFATSHEYFIVYAKDIKKANINGLSLDERDIQKYKYVDDISQYGLLPLQRGGSNSSPKERPNLYFPIYIDSKDLSIHLEKKSTFYVEILPKDSEGNQKVWRWSKKKILDSLGDIEVKKTNSGYSIFTKDRIKSEKKAKTFWSHPKYSSVSHGTMILKNMKLEGKFSYPKSVHLMKDIVKILANSDDLILDYHAGSGTTGQAVLNLNEEDNGNRKFILIEQMDYIKTVTAPRITEILKRSKLEDSFVYCELAKWNEKAKEEIQNAKDLPALVKLFDTLYEKYFLNYNIKIKDFKEKIIKEDNFKKLTLVQQKKMFLTMLDLNQMYVQESEMADKKYGISTEDQKLTKAFYSKK